MRGPRQASTGARRWAVACAAGLFLAAVGTGPRAQPPDEPEARALTGVLQRIKSTGVVRIGYREAAVPFSYAGPEGRPYGYSIDLCHAIVVDIARAVGGASLRVEYRRVTPADRLEQVVDGRIDLECGTTTNTAERRRLVAFSPLTFVAGTRLLVARGSAVRSARDLAGRRAVVVRGTTNEEAMRTLAAGRIRGLTVLASESYEQALARLESGEADALAADDILLAGFLAEKRRGRPFVIVGERLSHEAYGIAFAKDDAPLAEAVRAAFARLAATREIRWTYDKWFLRTLPSGVRLAWPMGPELERSFQVLGLPVS